MVMPAELQTFGGDDLSNPIELAPKRGPFGLAALPLAGRRRRSVNRLNAQARGTSGPRRPDRRVAGRGRHAQIGADRPCRSQLALEALRIVQKAAERFDLLIAEPCEQFELSLQGLESAGGVELKRETVDGRHGHSLSIRRLQSAPGSGVKQIEFVGRKPKRNRISRRRFGSRRAVASRAGGHPALARRVDRSPSARPSRLRPDISPPASTCSGRMPSSMDAPS